MVDLPVRLIPDLVEFCFCSGFPRDLGPSICDEKVGSGVFFAVAPPG